MGERLNRTPDAAGQPSVEQLRQEVKRLQRDLLRRCRALQIDRPRAALPGQVQGVLQQALAVHDRYAAGTISLHGVAVARGHLETRLARLLDQRTTLPAGNQLHPRLLITSGE